MTPKQRWLAAVRMQELDRLPFWPKLDAAYAPAQAPRFCRMDLDSIHDWIGSDRHQGIPGCVREARKRTSVGVVTDGEIHRTIFTAGAGRTELVKKFDPPSRSWHPVEFPVRSLEHVRILTEVFADCTAQLDAEGLGRARQAASQIGPRAVTATCIGESPLMYWVEWLAGVENAHYFLADHRGEVEGLFQAIHALLSAKAEILCEHSPADLIYLSENTSTTLISPRQYRTYCLRHIGDYAEIGRRAGRHIVLHMCGHLKALLADLARLPVAAFEAFTTPTVGNTTLLDGRSACPDKCLIGGTNATLWTRSAGEIIDGIRRELDCLPHHRGLVVTSAGVMPPLCKPQTIRTVCEWVKTYPART